MRICILEGDMSRTGGTERMAAWLANALCKRHQVHVLSLRSTDGRVFYPLSKEVEYRQLPPFAGKLCILKQIRWIKRYLKEHQIHRIINVDMGMGFYGILAAKGTDARPITWEHGNYYNNWDSRLFPHLRRYAAKKSDAVVLLTQKDKENYDKHIRHHAPVTVIGNPAARHDYTYDTASRTILSVGHLQRNKGYHRVVEIAAKILPTRPEWQWVIWGEGPEREALEKQIREAGLEGRVLLPGLTKDMDAQYQKAAMLVLTSDMEGLPMTLLEGKSWGLPLVAFDIMTGPSDIIDDGANGCLIAAFDLDAMSGKLATLMDDATLRQQLSDNAAIGMDKFSEERILSAWEELLK
ncbi:MAG: glycosyltransferase family 4 protein [Oscillospiraceae bacterium]|nr:glycosyltransferase family 4 protein [Oscillospiraceae bacterium]